MLRESDDPKLSVFIGVGGGIGGAEGLLMDFASTFGPGGGGGIGGPDELSFNATSGDDDRSESLLTFFEVFDLNSDFLLLFFLTGTLGDSLVSAASLVADEICFTWGFEETCRKSGVENESSRFFLVLARSSSPKVNLGFLSFPGFGLPVEFASVLESNIWESSPRREVIGFLLFRELGSRFEELSHRTGGGNGGGGGIP